MYGNENVLHPTDSIEIPLAKLHLNRLARNARESNVPFDLYVQRLLQHDADSELQLPNANARAVGDAARAVMQATGEQARARRAYEQADGNDNALAAELRQAAAASRTAMDALAAAVERV